MADQQEEPAQGTGSILSWYDSSRPMFIDLVGDYAGKELFLVEGDSLLRECFEDNRIDFECESWQRYEPRFSLPVPPLRFQKISLKQSAWKEMHFSHQNAMLVRLVEVLTWTPAKNTSNTR